MVTHLCIYGINSLRDLNCQVNRNLILVLTCVKLPPHALQSVSPKHQCVMLSLSLPTKQWKFLCVTHTIGRTFSGGSQLRCYVDGDLVSSEKCRYVKSSLVCCDLHFANQFYSIIRSKYYPIIFKYFLIH